MEQVGLEPTTETAQIRFFSKLLIAGKAARTWL